jgi:TonB family protein
MYAPDCSSHAPCFRRLPSCLRRTADPRTDHRGCQRLLHKPLFLRTLPGDDNLKFDGEGKSRNSYKVVPFSVAGIDVTKVELSFGRLFIEGQRVGLVFDENGNMSRLPLTVASYDKNVKPEKISIMIDRTTDGDFGPALDAVFAPSLADLIPAMPEYWQAYAQQYFSAKAAAEPASDAPKRARFRRMDGVQAISGSMKPPSVATKVAPKYSEYARRMNFSRKVNLYMIVDEAGTPSHVSIVKPAGLGLDEQAVAAVEQYHFSPASKDGSPVKVDVYMEINFESFRQAN